MRILILGLMLLALPGCTAGCRNDMKHLQSDWTGLNRRITVYGATGEPIRHCRRDIRH